MPDQYLINRFRGARSDPSLVVLEGFHPLKHALRFGAEVEAVVGFDSEAVLGLGLKLAPDILSLLEQHLVPVPKDDFEQLAPVPPSTGVIALAKRPAVTANDILSNGKANGKGKATAAPVVLLERPRSPFNIGAAIRVAAAAGAAGVLTTGIQDPWHPSAVVTGVGLQFALPVARSEMLPAFDQTGGQTLLVFDPNGEPLQPGEVPTNSVLAFGNERDGASPELLAAADYRISIPMTPGVSSLNLATAVAVVMYSWKMERQATE
jgi:TrmH family RNA methyltransferase